MNGGLNTIFLTYKNVFGLEGEAICQFVFFFFLYCIAAGRTRSFFDQNLVFSLGSGGGIFYFLFLHAFHLSQSLLRISSSAKRAFCRHQFGVFHLLLVRSRV